MGKMKPLRLSLLLVFTGLLGAYWLWPGSEAPPALVQGPSNSIQEPTPPAQASPALKVVAAAASTPSLPKPAVTPDILTNWTQGFSSDQPYALALQLRNARLPGSFGAALTLTKNCRSAMGLVRAGELLGPEKDPLLRARGAPNYAQRLQARDTLESRCLPFTQHADIDEPLADDGPGLALNQAIGHIPNFFVPSKARQIAQLLAEQGQLHLYVGVLPYWDGKAMRASEERLVYQAALVLAVELATAPAVKPEQDIRLLTECLRSGRCAKDFIELHRLSSTRSPEAQARVEGLAQEMAAAMRAGDYQKFAR